MKRVVLACSLSVVLAGCPKKEAEVIEVTAEATASPTLPPEVTVDVTIDLPRGGEDIPSDQPTPDPYKQDPAKLPPPPPPPIERPNPSGPGGIGQATTERVAGTVDPASIQQAVARRSDLFRRCLSQDAFIEVVAMVSPSGQILDARSSKSTPDDPKIRDCLVDAFRQLTLPPSSSDSPARVKFVIALKRPT